MDFNIDFQTLLGIAVSVFLFIIGYRETVGAKKERIRIANNEIQQTILKRIVLDSYNPTLDDLSRIIDGKSRDHRVKSNELLSPIQILNTLFTRIVESDFIASDQREKILDRLNPIIVAAEKEPFEEIKEIETSQKWNYFSIKFTLIAAILTSLIGSLFTLYQKEVIPSKEMGLVFILSILIITFLTVILRFKESQEEPSKSPTLQDYYTFEKEVESTLKKFSVLKEYGHVSAERGYDFYVEINGKGVIIEVKTWPKKISTAMLQNTIDRLKRALESEEKATEAIIITKNPIAFPSEIIQNIPIRVMAFKEFRNYLVHIKK